MRLPPFKVDLDVISDAIKFWKMMCFLQPVSVALGVAQWLYKLGELVGEKQKFSLGCTA